MVSATTNCTNRDTKPPTQDIGHLFSTVRLQTEALLLFNIASQQSRQVILLLSCLLHLCCTCVCVRACVHALRACVPTCLHKFRMGTYSKYQTYQCRFQVSFSTFFVVHQPKITNTVFARRKYDENVSGWINSNRQ